MIIELADAIYQFVNDKNGEKDWQNHRKQQQYKCQKLKIVYKVDSREAISEVQLLSIKQPSEFWKRKRKC